jgi:nitrate reductase NapD
MNISGVLLHAHPNRLAPLRRQLGRMPGLEIHATTGEGRLVLTLEEADGVPLGEALLKLQGLEGVLSAALVYHHSEIADIAREREDETVEA